MSEELELATIELLGALAYGQLRSFEATARTVRLAPDVQIADEVAAVALDEHRRYERLRDHLSTRTERPTLTMERQRPAFDEFFDRAPLDDWFGACAFFALGLPIATDFARDIAPALDDAAAAVVTSSLDKAGTDHVVANALAAQLTDDESRERARRLTGDMLGRALTSFQGAMAQTDALKVLLAADTRPEESGEQRVKRLALTVMDGHRRRAVALGLEDVDDVDD